MSWGHVCAIWVVCLAQRVSSFQLVLSEEDESLKLALEGSRSRGANPVYFLLLLLFLFSILFFFSVFFVGDLIAALARLIHALLVHKG